MRGCSSLKSQLPPLPGALHLPVQVLQPHLSALESLSQPDPPGVVLLHDRPSSAVVLGPRGLHFKVNLHGYTQVVCCYDI